jgi:hypothetical protein
MVNMVDIMNEPDIYDAVAEYRKLNPEPQTRQWTIQSATRDIAELVPLLAKVGYCIGLTGGVLFRGQSDKDVDFILYPLGDPMDYREALRVVRSFYNDAPIFRVIHPYDSKLVYVINAYRRVDIFVIGQVCNDKIMTSEEFKDYDPTKAEQPL